MCDYTKINSEGIEDPHHFDWHHSIKGFINNC